MNFYSGAPGARQAAKQLSVSLQFKMETYPPATIKSVFSIEIHLAAVFDSNRCPLESHVDLLRHRLNDGAAL